MSDHKKFEPPADHGDNPERMQLILLASCANGSCPTIYRTMYGTLIIQGRAISAEQTDIDLAPGELLVEIPEALIVDLAIERALPHTSASP